MLTDQFIRQMCQHRPVGLRLVAWIFHYYLDFLCGPINSTSSIHILPHSVNGACACHLLPLWYSSDIHWGKHLRRQPHVLHRGRSITLGTVCWHYYHSIVWSRTKKGTRRTRRRATHSTGRRGGNRRVKGKINTPGIGRVGWTIFHVMQGIRANAGNSKEGAIVSRVFPIRSVNVVSLAGLLDHCREVDF